MKCSMLTFVNNAIKNSHLPFKPDPKPDCGYTPKSDPEPKINII